ANPIYSAAKISIPVFTIGIGDTSRRIDVKINRVLYNKLLYEQTPTPIIVTIQNNGLGEARANLSLYENNILIEQKPVMLSTNGIQNEIFSYTPNSDGEKKLSVIVSKVKDEFTTANNRKIFYVKVLSNKIRVVILAGTPSSDLSFIKNTLKSDENLTVKSITQLAKNKFIEGNSFSPVDSADIIFMVGFPSTDTPSDLLNKVSNRIVNEQVPYFFTFSNSVDLNKLNQLQPQLPFTIKNAFRGFQKVQPQIYPEQKDNPIIQNDAKDILKAWNDLPPVSRLSYDFIPKPEAVTISKIKVNNRVLNDPLILSRSFNGKRSTAVLANEIWRWKLQTATKGLNLFDRFILNSVRWLNTPEEEKKVDIKTSRKIYATGEKIEFSAQVYDESLNPVADASVKIKIRSGEELLELDLSAKVYTKVRFKLIKREITVTPVMLL
ncbi:MAG: hypothetical protein ACE5D6_09215, partial [Candidatus Zixiibacteriota bacterium]